MINEKKEAYNAAASTVNDIDFLDDLIDQLKDLEITTLEIEPYQGGTLEDKNEFVLIMNKEEKVYMTKKMADSLITHLKTVYLPGLKMTLEALLSQQELVVKNLIDE